MDSRKNAQNRLVLLISICICLIFPGTANGKTPPERAGSLWILDL